MRVLEKSLWIEFMRMIRKQREEGEILWIAYSRYVLEELRTLTVFRYWIKSDRTASFFCSRNSDFILFSQYLLSFLTVVPIKSPSVHQMLFFAVISVPCLLVSSVVGLSVGRDDGQFRTFFDAGDIERDEETAFHLSHKRDVSAQQCATKINPDLQKCYDISTRAAVAAKSPGNAL